jgi:hypothetical protein
MRNFFRNPRVLRSGSATRYPASPDARSGELSPRRTAAGTRSPSRARRVCKIARQVFVEAVHGALPARHLRRPGMRRTGAWATWVHPRKMRMAPCHIQPVRPPSTSPAWGSCRPTHDLPPLQRNPRRARIKQVRTTDKLLRQNEQSWRFAARVVARLADGEWIAPFARNGRGRGGGPKPARYKHSPPQAKCLQRADLQQQQGRGLDPTTFPSCSGPLPGASSFLESSQHVRLSGGTACASASTASAPVAGWWRSSWSPAS